MKTWYRGGVLEPNWWECFTHRRDKSNVTCCFEVRKNTGESCLLDSTASRSLVTLARAGLGAGRAEAAWVGGVREPAPRSEGRWVVNAWAWVVAAVILEEGLPWMFLSAIIILRGKFFLLCDFLRTGTKRKMRGFPGTAVLTAQWHHAHPEKVKA